MTDLPDEWADVPDDPPIRTVDAVESMLNNGLVVHHPIDESAYVYSDLTIVLEDQAEPVHRERRHASE